MIGELDDIYVAEFECGGCDHREEVRSDSKIDEVPYKYCPNGCGEPWERVGSWTQERGRTVADGGGRERLISSWTDKPYTSHRKRHHEVEHRVKAVWYPSVGADVIHEVRSEDRGVDDWQLAEKWEFRDHGVDKMSTEYGGLL